VTCPPEVAASDVGVDVEDAEAAVDVSCGDVVEPAVAPRETTHASGAVVVEAA